MVASLRLLAGFVFPHSDLPGWQQAILSVVGVALAYAILYGLYWLTTWRAQRRDRRLRACFLGIQRAWARSDAAALTPFVTPQLGAQLRGQLDDIARSGRVIHHERPRVKRLRVVRGGGKDDAECFARIESSVRHWLTESATGAIAGGHLETDHDSALWRFERDPARGDWVATEINASLPPAGGR